LRSMNSIPTACPFCEGELVVRELHCRQCDTTFQGRFQPGPTAEFDEAKLPVLRRFARLSVEQLALLEAFVRCEGKLNRLQEEIGISYPTLRSRLNDALQTMGFTPQEEEKTQKLGRRQILDDLAEGKISTDEATRLLKGISA